MPRTLFPPPKPPKIRTKAQQDQWSRYNKLARVANPARQRLEYRGQDSDTKAIHFDNFFMVSGEWRGYKFTIDRHGVVITDKTWICKQAGERLYLTKANDRIRG